VLYFCHIGLRLEGNNGARVERGVVKVSSS